MQTTKTKGLLPDQQKGKDILEALRQRDDKLLRGVLGSGGDWLADPARLLRELHGHLPLPWLVQMQPEFLALVGNNDAALLALARAWRALRGWDPAEHALRLLLGRSPSNRPALLDLLNLLHIHARATDAFALLQPALAVYPGDAELLLQLGASHLLRNEIEPALAAYQLAEEAGGPTAARAGQQFLLALAYLPDVTAADLLDASAEWEQRHAPVVPQKPRPVIASGRRIRIGYYSPDLRRHSITHFFLPLLTAHDRSRFECFVYSDTHLTDDFTARLRASAEHWTDLTALSETAAVETIAADRLDLLVDLAGHFGSTRPRLFACRPAPIQAHLLGYNGSTGLSSLDYRFSDPISDPVGCEAESSETVIRLDPGFHCFDPLVDPIDEGPPPSSLTGHITFGCFNSLPKLNDEVIALWCEVLRAIPTARLLLKAPQLRDAETRDSLLQRFVDRGIAAGRIDILPGTTSPAEHLLTYRRIDIALDPFPCNGTTTTCEALWMGVPVLTLPGARHSARVTASLLTQVAFTEAIARDAADYVQIARNWATDPERLATWRGTLRQRLLASPLGDAPAYAARVEAAYLALLG